MKNHFFRLFFSVTMITSLVLFNSCNDDDDVELNNGISLNNGTADEIGTNTMISAPVISSVTDTSAIVMAIFSTIDDRFPITQHGFVLSSSSSLPDTSDLVFSFGTLDEPDTVSATITILEPETGFFLRPFFVTDSGIGFGDVVEFETIPGGILLNEGSDNEIPTAVQLSIPEILSTDFTSINLTSEFLSLDENFAISNHGYVWSSDNDQPTLDDFSNQIGSVSDLVEINSEITNLDPATEYFIRAYFETDSGVGFGPIVSFATNSRSLAIAVNEGNFQAGNGSLSSFNITQGTTDLDVFDANATVQNAIRVENSLYLVTNAPDRLEILDISGETLTPSTSITSGFLNPISFASVGNFGFVTNWGDISTAFSENPDSFISIVDLSTNQVIDSLERGVRPQEIISVDSRLYVANEGGATVTVLEADGSELTVVTDIDVPFGPSIMVVDSQGDLWALCASGSLVEIDLETNTVVTTFDDITVNGFDEKMAINNSGSIIYFLGGTNDTFTGLTNVFSVDLTNPNPSVATFVSEGFAFYGIGVDPENGDVYVGDSNAFQSTGTGFRYSSDGTLITDFPTGIGPNSFLFL